MKKLAFIAISLFCVYLTGCAKYNFEYTPPSKNYEIETSKVFNYSYDTVWKETINALGSSFWTL